MKLKYLFYAHAVFAFFSGLSFIFAPAMTWNNWQVANPDSLMNLAGQNTGTMIIFVGLVACLRLVQVKIIRFAIISV